MDSTLENLWSSEYNSHRGHPEQHVDIDGVWWHLALPNSVCGSYETKILMLA